MNQQTTFDMLLNCGIKLALARLDAEKSGTKPDRDRVVYRYFSGKKLRPPKDAKKMIDTITRNIKYSAYAFDQYFQLYLGFKPGPDANPIGEKIKEGLLEQYGVEIVEETVDDNACTV